MALKVIGEETVFEGKIFQIIKQKVQTEKKVLEFEIARRAPGTRIIAIKNKSILLTREERREHGGEDYRLPGGKVFDTLSEYKNALDSKTNILDWAKTAAKKELLEETGIKAKKLTLLQITKAGATIDWDLYYFTAEELDAPLKQNLEEGEEIVPEWKTFEEVKKLCIEGKIKEDRTVGVLLKLINKI